MGCAGDGYSVVNGVTYDESNPSETQVSQTAVMRDVTVLQLIWCTIATLQELKAM